MRPCWRATIWASRLVLPEERLLRCYGRPGAEVPLGRFVTAAAVAPAACQTPSIEAHPTFGEVQLPSPLPQDSPRCPAAFPARLRGVAVLFQGCPPPPHFPLPSASPPVADPCTLFGYNRDRLGRTA